jgi:hypothetical protein
MRTTFEASEAMFAAVESWRARQRPIPSQTAALRQLVELGLAAEPDGGLGRDKEVDND